jgi:hypothetical protein
MTSVRRIARRLWNARWRLAGASAIALIAAVLWVRLGSLPDGLLGTDTRSVVIVDRHGEVLYEARTAYGTRGLPLAAADIPRALAHATLAAEDRRFESHLRLSCRCVTSWPWQVAHRPIPPSMTATLPSFTLPITPKAFCARCESSLPCRTRRCEGS